MEPEPSTEGDTPTPEPQPPRNVTTSDDAKGRCCPLPSSSKRMAARVLLAAAVPVFLRMTKKSRTLSGSLRGRPFYASASAETRRGGKSCTMAPVPVGVCGRSVGPTQAARIASVGTIRQRLSPAFPLTPCTRPSSFVASVDKSALTPLRSEIVQAA